MNMEHFSNPLFYYVVSLVTAKMSVIFHLFYLVVSVVKNMYFNKGDLAGAVKQSFNKHKRDFMYIYAVFAIAIVVPFGIQYYQFHKNAIVYESAMPGDFSAKDFIDICKEDGHGAIYKYNAEQNVTYARCSDPFTITAVRFPGKVAEAEGVFLYRDGSLIKEKQ